MGISISQYRTAIELFNTWGYSLTQSFSWLIILFNLSVLWVLATISLTLHVLAGAIEQNIGPGKNVTCTHLSICNPNLHDDIKDCLVPFHRHDLKTVWYLFVDMILKNTIFNLCGMRCIQSSQKILLVLYTDLLVLLYLAGRSYSICLIMLKPVISTELFLQGIKMLIPNISR